MLSRQLRCFAPKLTFLLTRQTRNLHPTYLTRNEPSSQFIDAYINVSKIFALDKSLVELNLKTRGDVYYYQEDEFQTFTNQIFESGQSNLISKLTNIVRSGYLRTTEKGYENFFTKLLETGQLDLALEILDTLLLQKFPVNTQTTYLIASKMIQEKQFTQTISLLKRLKASGLYKKQKFEPLLHEIAKANPDWKKRIEDIAQELSFSAR